MASAIKVPSRLESAKPPVNCPKGENVIFWQLFGGVKDASFQHELQIEGIKAKGPKWQNRLLRKKRFSVSRVNKARYLITECCQTTWKQSEYRAHVSKTCQTMHITKFCKNVTYRTFCFYTLDLHPRKRFVDPNSDELNSCWVLSTSSVLSFSIAMFSMCYM